MLPAAYALTALMGLGIIVIGARAILVPRAAAAGFGVPVAHDGAGIDPYLAIKGVRDIGTGLIGLALLLAAIPQVVGWYLVAAAAIPLGDMLIVLRYKGPKAAAYGIHGVTAMVMLAVAAALMLG